MFSTIFFGIIFLLICYIGIGLYYALPYILIAGAVGIVVWLISCLILKKKGKLQKQSSEKKNSLTDLANALTNVAAKKGATVIPEEKSDSYYLNGIDFGDIESVDIIDSQMTYIIEEREEFDPVMSNFLTDMDGWQHYETKTVEYQVENGYEYTFLISFFNSPSQMLTYHEDSPVAQKLIEISENSGLQQNIVDEFSQVANSLSSDVLFSCGNVYEAAKENLEKLFWVCGLSSESTDQDIVDACGVKMTSILFSSEENRVNAICELMYFLLCETEDDAEKFGYPDIDKVNFIQEHSGGTDAFCVLEYGADVDDKVIFEYDKLRQENGYRKICLLTVGNNNSNSEKETVLVWDMKTLIQAYFKAFKRLTGIVGDKTSPFTCVSSEVNEDFAKKEDAVVIDIETTGLNFDYKSPDMDEILSVAIVDLEGNVLLDKMCGTERKNSWYEAEKVNGISPEDVYGLDTFSDILSEVLLILSSYDNVIAYNISFEKQFIEAYIKRNNPLDLVNYKINWAIHKDPLDMYLNYTGGKRWVKLENAVKGFGYTFNAHNSLEDAKATVFLYNKLCEEFRKQKT